MKYTASMNEGLKYMNKVDTGLNVRAKEDENANGEYNNNNDKNI